MDDSGLDRNETRGFNYFIMRPIANLYKFIEDENIEGIKKLAKKQGFLESIHSDDLLLTGKDLHRKIF